LRKHHLRQLPSLLVLLAGSASTALGQTAETSAYKFGYSLGTLIGLGIVLWVIVKLFQLVVRAFRR
jgi:hypothetical protein